ncbi:MAG: dephospho-CoA kinase [Candidatus Stygibacter frigidus]|nr:dephospho-CoA kinase [Candidatus Stygibacter frigidus]
MRRNKLSIAITGGIGSGKSEVCQWFGRHDIEVISADKLAHEALGAPSIQQELIDEFGDSIWREEQIDRQELGNIVFKDAKKTAKLNEIMHPYIISRINKMLETQTESILVFEIPLLYEAGLENLFDIIVMVWTSENVRMERLLKRNGMTERKIYEIMAKQFSQETARHRADYVIENNGSYIDLEKKLQELMLTLKQRI